MDADRKFVTAPFTAAGVVCVVAGGLVAAATAPAPSANKVTVFLSCKFRYLLMA